jgi:hypothetical protein
MEVFVKMEGLGTRPRDEPKTIMLGESEKIHISTQSLISSLSSPGRFSIVCRDAETHGAKKCPQLVLNTQEEKAMFAIGEDHKNRKKIASKIALDKIPPSQGEINMLHDMMLKVAEREKQLEDSGRLGVLPMQSSLKEEIVCTRDTEVRCGWSSWS